MKRIIIGLLLTCSALSSIAQVRHDFDDFFIQFSSDCQYQFSHIKDSIVMFIFNELEENQEEYFDVVNLHRMQLGCIDFSLYDNSKVTKSDHTAVICSKGSDSGILYEFYFEIIEDDWMLCKIIDKSM